ncbi:hypothetical protein ZIOFF_028473 [Zingiber officinale]|uniref:WPP domain-containing protein n=1 Tax=Zingiber officinale TaxID=94328 RepID=A0A8J5GV39_ZINOF|nr:hypothetical protein ZIOFF_028473 [Zingiber officinale]
MAESAAAAAAAAAAEETRSELEGLETLAFGVVPSLSLKIWPPTQRTHDAVIHRLVETLATQSVLSKLYDLLSEEEATRGEYTVEEDPAEAASLTVMRNILVKSPYIASHTFPSPRVVPVATSNTGRKVADHLTVVTPDVFRLLHREDRFKDREFGALAVGHRYSTLTI